MIWTSPIWRNTTVQAVLGLALLANNIAATEIPKARVGDYAVSADEYAFHADRIRTKVVSRLMREYAVPQTPGFWSTPLDGISPEAILEQEVLEEITRFVALQSIGVRMGILESIRSYAQFIEALNAENTRRQKARSRGEIIYGPLQFGKDAYYEVWVGQIRMALNRRIRSQQGNPAGLSEGGAEEILEQFILGEMASLAGS